MHIGFKNYLWNAFEIRTGEFTHVARLLPAVPFVRTIRTVFRAVAPHGTAQTLA